MTGIEGLAHRLVTVEDAVSSRPGKGVDMFGGGVTMWADVAGHLVAAARFGRHPDGGYGVVVYHGPTPPAPTRPGVTDVAGLVIVTWDGRFTDDRPRPSDLAGVEVVVGGRVLGWITCPSGGQAVVHGDGPVHLTTRTTSGAVSVPSETTTRTEG